MSSVFHIIRTLSLIFVIIFLPISMQLYAIRSVGAKLSFQDSRSLQYWNPDNFKKFKFVAYQVENGPLIYAQLVRDFGPECKYVRYGICVRYKKFARSLQIKWVSPEQIWNLPEQEISIPHYD